MFLILLLLVIVKCNSDSSDGFVGFFTSDCPTGWSELEASKGRMILSINNSYQAGETLGFPLSDGEDRTHQHLVEGFFNLASKQVSALGGSNTDSAHSGKQPLLSFLNTTLGATSGLPFVQLTACRYNSISFQPAPQLPIGGVSFWDPTTATKGCPPGSQALQAASGRLVVLGNATGISINPGVEPLLPGKDIPHTHAFSVSISLDNIDFDGIHGCCDGDPTSKGQATATGVSAPSSLNLPYITILTCNSTQSSATLALPPSMLFFTTDPSGCPTGWAPTQAGGRVLLATPAFGIPGKVFGGDTPISPSNPYPQHPQHDFFLDFSLTPAAIELATHSGGDYGRKGDFYAQGSTLSAATAQDEQLPVVTLLACQKA